MDPLLPRLQAALAGRYTIEAELGRGGMAVVLLGRDLRLDRRVAIKVFEQDRGLTGAAERFLREIRVAAQLQHPNILPVFESGETAGLVYYVMPYVAGASLRERLERDGPLPVAEAVRIAREVAEALDYAHRAGIVHRDIKPDNIMLADGMAVVADFGIARALVESGGRVTEAGLAVGTPTYMSPEQATASPQVDGRADVYALGCVLYEMLTGMPPFSGSTGQAVMARHAADAVPPLQTVRPVPPALEAAVLTALAKLPGDRWSTGRAFAEALRATEVPPVKIARYGWRGAGWAAAGVALLAVVAAVWKNVGTQGPPSGVPGESLRSVAVLPFDPRGDTALAALADGLTETVINGLVRLKGLRVPSSNRAFAYRDRDVRTAGRELGVETVLQATLDAAGSRIRVTAQLVNTRDGLLLWSGQFNGDLLDVFAMQDSITARIVDALLPRLAPADRAVLSRGMRTRDSVAFRLYLEARRATYVEMTRAGLERAKELLEEALRRDSSFADAWVGLYDVHYFQYMYGGVSLESVVARRYAVERAIELDSVNGPAFASRAEVRYSHDWDWEGAWRDMRRAVQLSPGSPDAAVSYAGFLNLVDQPDSALTHMRRAVTLDPTSSHYWTVLGNLFAHAGMRDSALRASERARELDPDWVWANWVQMNGYLDAGRRAEADSAAERMRRLGADQPGALAFVAGYYRRAGNPSAAREIVKSLAALGAHRYVPPSIMAAARLAAGDRAGALQSLEQAVADRDPDLAMHFMLSYAPLRGDARYETLARMVFGGRPVPRYVFP